MGEGSGQTSYLATTVATVAALTSLGMVGLGIYAFRAQQRQLRDLIKKQEEDARSGPSNRGRKSGFSRRPERRTSGPPHVTRAYKGRQDAIPEDESEGLGGDDHFSRPDSNLADWSRLQRQEFIADQSSMQVPNGGRAPPSEDEKGSAYPAGSTMRPRNEYLSQEEGMTSVGEGAPAVQGGREGVFRAPMASIIDAAPPRKRSGSQASGTGSAAYTYGRGYSSGPVHIPGTSVGGGMPGAGKNPPSSSGVPGTPSKSGTYGSLAKARASSSAMHLLDEAQLSMSPRTLVESDYARLIAPQLDLTAEQEEVSAMLIEALQMRDRYLFKEATQPHERAGAEEKATLKEVVGEDPFTWKPIEAVGWVADFQDGVMQVWEDASRENLLFAPPAAPREFFGDFQALLKMTSSGPVKTFCHHRLLLLEQKFNLHLMLNSEKEFDAQRLAPHRDFYNVRKVDTHVHHSAGMHQKHLLRFIKSKLKKEGDQVVIFRDGKYLTLAEVFESLNLSAYDLNIDLLDMHVDKSTFHRFDKFNSKYNPCGQSRLREIFIKQDNLLHGRFLAELTSEMIHDLEASKYQHAEYRISIYGRQQREWDTLAAWVVQNRLYSNNVVWMIQIPRLYSIYKEQGLLANFGEMLDNIFAPLFEVTLDPSTHPHLHMFLKTVVGFDMVDDESRPERRPGRSVRMPAEWNGKHNPAYAYYAYFLYANLYTLNKLREARGMNTFSFRPHCGEAGDVDHLVAGFMLAENVAHGINLRKSSSLQYLYYLGKIGLCMSPLSNNSLFLDYHRNPFPTFFARGLNVSLSSDDPVQIHLTKEPLVEEYSVAAQVWKLSATDLCEISRSSVLQSGFPHECKMHWVAEEYWKHGPAGNDIQKTNVPDVRLRFRMDAFVEEVGVVVGGAHSYAHKQRAKLERELRESRE